MSNTMDNNTSSWSQFFATLKEYHGESFLKHVAKGMIKDALENGTRSGNFFEDVVNKDIRDRFINDTMNLIFDENNTANIDKNLSYTDNLLKNSLEELVYRNYKDNPFDPLVTDNMKNALIDDMYNAIKNFFNIVDDLLTPTKTTAPKQAFYISNEEVFEIDGKVVFFVTNLTDEAIKVNLGTQDGSAGSSDYTPTNGSLDLAPYETKPFEVVIKQDNEDEKAERFYLKGVLDRTSLSNLHLKYGQYNIDPYAMGECTIYDKNPVDIKISRPVVVENDPSGKVKFIITLSKAVNETLTFDVFTDDDTAKAGDDYTAINGKTIFIPAGTTRYELEVDLINDSEAETPAKEVFGLWLRPTNDTQIHKYDLDGYYQSYGTIYDDDGETVYVTIEDKTLQEGDGNKQGDSVCALDKIAVTLSRELKDNETISVNFGNQTLEFSASSDTTLYYDFEHDGNFSVNAEKLSTHTLSPTITSNNVNAKLTKDGLITIQDDDNPVYVIIKGNSASEAAEKLTGSVSLSRSLKEGEYVNVSVAGKRIEFTSANSNDEFEITWGDDKIVEEDCKFYVRASIISTNATVYFNGKGGKCVIIDDDKDKDPRDPERESSPIVIDLNNDGINSMKLDYTVKFDLDNNGFKESTGWVFGDDALLAIDKNGNGIIDNGSELFGNKTISNNNYSYTDKNANNGFEVLAKYDSNNDGVIDANDAEFDKLLLWQDNGNGITEDGELIKLSDKVKSINLNYKNVTIDNNTNTIRQSSTAVLNDGTEVRADDIWFKVDLKKTQEDFNEEEFSEEIKALPQIEASGNLSSLWVAMSKNSALLSFVKSYLDMDSQTRKDNIEQLVRIWTNVLDININSRGSNIDARNLAIYELITGKPFLQHGNTSSPGSGAASVINGHYKEFLNYVYSEFELQTTYEGLIDTEYMVLRDNGALEYDFANFNAKMKELYADEKYNEIGIIKSLLVGASVYRPKLANALFSNLQMLGLENEYFYKVASDNVLVANADGGRIDGTSVADYIAGSDNVDQIYAGNGNDTLIGGTGNDTLNGGYGDDTYIFNLGDGADIISDESGVDTIKFGSGITKDMLVVKRQSGNDCNLVISIKDTNDSITIQNIYSYTSYIGYDKHYRLIENFEFADGTKLSFREFEEQTAFIGTSENDTILGTNLADTIYGNDGIDTVRAYGGNDTIYGGKGNDTIYGGENDDTLYGNEDNDILYGDNGNDTLYGNEGNDTLNGGANNDTLIGGTGNDTLNGGYGDDTYIFNLGDGADTIIDGSGNNVVKFGEGITKEEITFKRISNDLVLKYGTDESVKINSYFSNNNYKIEKVELNSGEFITSSQIDKIIEQVNTYASDNGITSFTNDDMRNNAAMMQIVMSGWGN